MLLLFWLVGLVQAAPDGPISLGYELRFLDAEKFPLAVCNDGSPAAYYFYRGGDATQWIFHQQGGWWCWDEFSCQVRWDHFANHTVEFRSLMSTKDLATLTAAHDTFNGEKNTGLLQHNASNPLGPANKIFLVYCSSDSHAGNLGAGMSPGNSRWHFRGKEIVKAVLTELQAEGLAKAVSFVLTGGSAGGMATILNADFVGEIVTAASPSVRYVTMPDSGFFSDVMPHRMCSLPDTYECKCAAGGGASNGSAATGFLRPDGHAWLGPGQSLAQQMQGLFVYTGGVVGKNCAEAYGRFGAWKCYLGQYAAPYLSHPTLFLQNQIDEWQGFWNGFFNFAQDPADYEYALWFRGESSLQLQAAASSLHVHVFGPNCYHHGLSYDPMFWSVMVDGWTSASLLSALINGTAPRTVLDYCDGLPCSPGTHGFPDCG